MRLTLATEPAYPDRPNEDFIGATPDAVVLLDGAGTLRIWNQAAPTASPGTHTPSARLSSPG